MCVLNTYSCTLTCLNAEFPASQEMTLAAINNLSEIQKHACKMTCALTEVYSEGSNLTDPIPKEGLFGLFIMAIIFSFIVYLSVAGILWPVNKENKEEPPQ